MNIVLRGSSYLVVTVNRLLPCSSVLSLSHLASTVGLGSILTKLALFLAVFPNLSSIVLEMVVAAEHKKEPLLRIEFPTPMGFG